MNGLHARPLGEDGGSIGSRTFIPWPPEGLHYKTSWTCKFQKINRFRSKLVSSVVSYKHTYYGVRTLQSRIDFLAQAGPPGDCLIFFDLFIE